MKFTSLKILTDENISPRIVAFLRENSFDVLDTKEQNWHGKEDAFILSQAMKADRFVLTFDSDFGALTIHDRKQFYGIIYLRPERPTSANTIDVLKKLIEINPDVSPRQIIVITDKKVRIRLVE